MWDVALEHFHESGRGDDVVLAHDQQCGSPQGVDLLGGRPRGCHLLARRIEGTNLLIEKRLGRLLLWEVTRIRAGRRIRPGQGGFTFGTQLRHARIAKASRGVSHHQRWHALRIGEREPQAGAAPHRLGYQRGALYLEVIEQAFEILHKGLAARAMRGIKGLSKAPMIEADAAILPRQHRHLLPPAQVVATRSVGKDDSRTLSMRLVVQFNPIYLCFWHMRCPRSSRRVWYEEYLRRAILAPWPQNDNATAGSRRG